MRRIPASAILIAAIHLVGVVRVCPAEDVSPVVEEVPPAPLVVVHVSALDNVLQRIQENLRQIERDDVSDVFQERFEDRVGGLKGMDRSQPFGIALFLPEALPPRPVPVVYAPVTNFDDLIKTLELGPVTVKRQETENDDESRFTLTMQRGGTREIVVRDGYAFLSRNESFLEGDVASLAKLAPRLADEYDIAAAVDITAISPLVRDVFLGMLRNQAQAELQRRDDEPLPQYIVRKANGLSTLELIENVLRDGETLTLGLSMREESANTVVELNVDAAADSEFARYLTDLASHPSSYSSLVNDREPLTFSASWKMSPREQRLGREWISSLAHGMTDRLRPAAADAGGAAAESGTPNTDAEFVPDPAVKSVVDALNATVDAGDFDLLAQFRELGAGRFGLIGALQVVGGETLAGGMRELLVALQSRGAELDVTQDVAEHRGIAVHRIRGIEQRDEDRRIYGEDSALYVGSSSQTLWFAIGSSRILSELEAAIDRLADATGEPARRQAPIQLVLQASPWLELSPRDDEDDTIRRRELSDEAFSSDNDGLKLEVRPTESGARVRVELEAGFARFLTLLIADRYDRSRL